MCVATSPPPAGCSQAVHLLLATARSMGSPLLRWLLQFLAMGDWGADTAAQKAAAVGMGVIAEAINATQVIALGDNFYHS